MVSNLLSLWRLGSERPSWAAFPWECICRTLACPYTISPNTDCHPRCRRSTSVWPSHYASPRAVLEPGHLLKPRSVLKWNN